jgi:predicted transcriptional regulator
MNKSEIINRVYMADLSKRAMLVILYLINRADKKMTCFPSINRISVDCSISERTVQRALNDLEESGFLSRESRYHERGGQRSNFFHILIPNIDIEEVNLFENEGDNALKESNKARFSVVKWLKNLSW